MVAVIVGLLAGGPVGRFKLAAGRDGASLEAEPMILRFLNIQGIAGIAVGLALAIMLVIQKGETRHWRKQSASSSSSIAQSEPRSPGPSPMYRAAADQARAADQANAARVAASQEAISERTANDIKPALPMLALALSACASSRKRRSRSRCWPSSATARPGRCPPRRC